MKKIERALLSVSDKSGIVEFAKGLHHLNIELLSTGGTANAIREAGIPVTDVSNFTSFPEMLDGRVKTLHPHIHAGLLYRRDDPEHVETMKKQGIGSTDLVCVNLYPFERTVALQGVTFEEAIENIDIGGPAMLRSAAKNMAFVSVVSDPRDYERVIQNIKENDGQTDPDLRKELGLKVFARLTEYNAAITQYLAKQTQNTKNTAFIMARTGGTELRYGENPHQQATLFKDPVSSEASVSHAEQLHGKEMSYNNYVDSDAALEAVKELAGTPGVAIIKHTNPCGYATGEMLFEALEAAWTGDPVSAFGSVIAVTTPVDIDTAEALKGRFVEALIAPEFDADALDYLKEKSKSIRLLKITEPLTVPQHGSITKQITGGLLVQDRDASLIDSWNVPTKMAFSEVQKGLAEFGVKVCKHVKSNAIVLVRQYKPGCYALLGMGAGQPNRVDAVRKLALTKAIENIAEQKWASDILAEAILVSDAFFPFPDSIEHAAAAGVRYVVQPGGSKRDEEVIEACDKHGVAMALTGMRHFRH